MIKDYYMAYSKLVLKLNRIKTFNISFNDLIKSKLKYFQATNSQVFLIPKWPANR